MPQIVLRFAPLLPSVRGHVVAADALINENILFLHTVDFGGLVLACGGLAIRGGYLSIEVDDALEMAEQTEV
ncbi:hypothetical protein GCM10027093_09140 [Paraburkholderia jirisanensis]